MCSAIRKVRRHRDRRAGRSLGRSAVGPDARHPIGPARVGIGGLDRGIAGLPARQRQDLARSSIARSIRPKKASRGCTSSCRKWDVNSCGPPKPGFEQFVVEQLRDKLGMQVITVGGIPASTHFAQVMVEADYRMKLIGIGLERAPVRLKSYVDSGQPHQVSPQRAGTLVLRAELRMRPRERRFAGDGAGGRRREAGGRGGSRRQQRAAECCRVAATRPARRS